MQIIKSLKGKRILIFGNGLSGQAVFFKAKELDAIPRYWQGEIILRKTTDIAVISPYFSKRDKIYADLISEGIPVYSEIDFAYLTTPRDIIAISGTNGKTTTVKITDGLLRSAGVDSTIAGNVGVPLTTSKNSKITVCEISSFMLEQSFFIRPLISTITNVEPDHLERHKTFGEYFRTKLKLFDLTQDYAILEKGGIIPPPEKLKKFYYSKTEKADLYVKENVIKYCDKNEEFDVVNVDEIALKGDYNLNNVLSALSLSIVYNGFNENYAEFLKEYKGEKFRFEYLGIVKNKKIYNDSKGTNCASTLAALNNLNGKIILLIGGYDKGEDYGVFFDKLKGKDIFYCIYGASGKRISEEAEKKGVKYVFYKNIEKAIRFALELNGDNLLFSPTTSSYDAFQNFEERGLFFNKIIEEYK